MIDKNSDSTPQSCAGTLRILAVLSLVLQAVWAPTSAAGADPSKADPGEPELARFVQEAEARHGAWGAEAARYLIAGMPERDRRELSAGFLLENLRLALEAREAFPWARAVPEEVFFNDVLPYASLDETREAWRQDFREMAGKLVADCHTGTEAAQALNKGFFDLVDVHYNTGRKRPNQSPSESMKLNMATCTGLSIILVDACRSVGLPARIVGTPLWTNKRGNHTWVEIWADGAWHYTGADEYNPNGLDRGWFTRDAANAIEEDWRHAIWATTWKRTGDHFPMVWDLDNKAVGAVNVTSRYARSEAAVDTQTTVYFRVFDSPGGTRLELPVEVLDESGRRVGSLTTRGGTTDLNDMPSLKLPREKRFVVRLGRDGTAVAAPLRTGSEASMTFEGSWSGLLASAENDESVAVKAAVAWLAWLPEERHLSIPEYALTEREAEQIIGLVWRTLRAEKSDERQSEMDAHVVKAAGKEMKLLEREFGKKPKPGRSLWISMHGGGNAPPAVNDRQWRNQIQLYEPEEGIVVAPRAPTSTWNLWHQSHIDTLFDRLIENYVVCRDVDPNRVYLMGYSAGGDGVYQLAPRMADRFAAAAMMAGHPNDASPLGLRNLPFMIFAGGRDTAYRRNEVAAEWGRRLDELQAKDKQGYEHLTTIYPDLGHWMQGRDRAALAWMSQRTRTPWPTKIVWCQSSRTHERFYWLQVPEDSARPGTIVRAGVDGQTITILVEGRLNRLNLRLRDKLVDLDKPIEVRVNGALAFSGTVERRTSAIWQSFRERLDPSSAATCLLRLTW